MSELEKQTEEITLQQESKDEHLDQLPSPVDSEIEAKPSDTSQRILGALAATGKSMDELVPRSWKSW